MDSTRRIFGVFSLKKTHTHTQKKKKKKKTQVNVYLVKRKLGTCCNMVNLVVLL